MMPCGNDIDDCALHVASGIHTNRNRFRSKIGEFMRQTLSLFIAVGTLSSCATLQPGAKEIKFVDISQLPKIEQGKCKKGEDVAAVSDFGASQAEVQIRNKAAATGANVILTKGVRRSGAEDVGGFSSDFIQGIAYTCPAQTLDALIDVNSL